MLSGFEPLARGRQVAAVLGQFYAIVGVVGFAISGFDGFAEPRGDALIFLTVNPLQNLIHLVVGWWLIRRATGSEPGARRAVVAALVILAALGLLGLTIVGTRPDLNVINANQAVNYMHLLTAVGSALWLAAPALSRTSKIITR